MTRPRRGRGPHRVDAKLLGQLTQELQVVLLIHRVTSENVGSGLVVLGPHADLHKWEA